MIRILLQFDDAYFVNAFSDYVSANNPELEFICCTSMEKATAYLQSSRRRLDAIIGEKQFLEQCRESNAIKLQAAEETVFSRPDGMLINIYQSGRAIIADIKSALALQKGYSTTTNEMTHSIVAVYSQQGGSGKTTIGYALALAAAQKGKQALYFNLEPAPYTEQLYVHEFKGAMDELLFALKDRRELAPIVLDTMERNESGVLIMPPFHTVGDLLSLTQNDLKEILRVFTESAGVDYLFMDLPCGFQPLNLWVLEECTTVLQIYSDDVCGRSRLKKSSEDIYCQDLSVKGMTVNVLNRCRKKGEEKGIDAKIPFSESLQQGRQVAEVQERNPAFLQSCMGLLNKIR